MEVTLALGILTFTLTALFGVFAVGARADRQSIMEMEATHVIQSMIAGRRARPVVDNDTTLILPRLDKKMPADSSTPITSAPIYLDRVGRVQSDRNAAEFALVYRVLPTAKTNGAANYSDVYCAIYWPSQGSPDKAEGRVEFATRVPLP